ncbi:MAG: hypothetical protein OEM97_04480, partial [Acidimicrobiia bacterium]|nr:hypothetical protein [Acidimicrobiia bacterium]
MRRTFAVLLAFLLSGCGGNADGTPPASGQVAGAAETLAVTTEAPAPVAASTPITTSENPAPVDVNVRSVTVGGMGAEYAEPVRCIVDLGVTSRRATAEESAQAAAASGTAMT